MRFSLIIFLLLIFALSACSLRDLDTRIGEVGEKYGSEGINNSESQSTGSKSLTEEQKGKIKDWLSENNLNDYGEAITTVYEKGAPFINDNKDVVTDRFWYILENHKEILEKIK
jgi:hypothetical protein